ncbi:MAG: DNA mismatch repair protein MutL, partial [Oscillospiraceae bacterium]|nr:DNA mismatch repair protein MutL [Oscillospiraceae bacterium]
IKSQLLTAALEEGYRNQIMKGKFPGCVLSVTLPVTAVDVNVHPAKTQVKFAREREVFDAVYHTVLDCLDARGAPIPAPKPVEQAVNPRKDFFQSMDARTYREQGAKSAARPPERPAVPARPAWDTEWKAGAKVADSAPEKPAYRTFQPAAKPTGSALGKPPASVAARPAEALPAEKAPAPPEAPVKPEAARRPFVPAIPAAQQALELPEQQTIELPKEAPWRIAGEVLHTYIICESGDGCVWLIDKHAAHERINFDRLKAAQEPPMRQTLLRPIAAELDREAGALLLENLELLEQFGFACEDFGDGAILVREVPADIDAGDTVATLEEFAENLKTGRDPAEKRENLLHTMACKAAIKGGWTSDVSELKVLVEKVQSGEVRFCPHGRPVAVKLTKYELEKMFKRA